VRREREEEWR